jgi:A/G-specific adenine glycosylase
MVKRQTQSSRFVEVWPELRTWFGVGARPLPWRKAPVDPYKIWISEVMSQQSTMKTVIPYFERWMELFPRLENLAAAHPDAVLRAWAGLGYYSRARNIHRAAQDIVAWRAQHGGEWPQEPQQWLEFKGVGPYTAAAVCAIAFARAAVPVDGNVLRVGARIFGLEDPLNSSADRNRIEAILAEAIKEIPTPEIPLFAQSLMELGALVCRPGGQALCEVCPLASICQARLEGQVPQWPRPKKRPTIQEKHLLAEISWDGGTQILLRQIPRGERLEGQWEFPLREVNPAEIEKLAHNSQLLGPVTHSITRYRFKVWGELRPRRPGRLGAGECLSDWQRDERHLTTLTRKLLLRLDSLLN